MSPIPRNRYIAFTLIAVLGLAIDLGSKSIVFDQLGGIGVAGENVFEFFGGWSTFRLFTSINHGALWGIGQGMTWLFALLSVVAVGGVITWLFVYRAAQSLWLTVSLALIMAGTLGNLYDRAGLHGLVGIDANGDPTVLYGVRDFLLFTFGSFHWPVFNFADVFLVTGAIMLGIQSLRVETAEKAATEQAAQDVEASSGPSASAAT
ncbi:MAG: signal peptidase II [Planctomycetota bacterium]|jgi:signal peptidase II